jgi:hypothetical protein
VSAGRNGGGEHEDPAAETSFEESLCLSMGRPRGAGSCAIALEDLREGGVTIELIKRCAGYSTSERRVAPA